MIGFNHLGRLGRLGNQMFQFAGLKGIARNRGFEFCIPYYSNEVDDGIGNMLKTELFNAFDIEVDKVSPIDAPLEKEPHFHFSEDHFNNCPDNVSLFGFYQTEKYFKHIEEEIRSDFTFKEEIRKNCQETFDTLEIKEPISLHIRRGDYTFNHDRHPLMTMKYYETCLSKFDDNRTVIIFSDDPKWCKQQELFADDRFLISEGGDTFHDLCLMSMCSDFIIANSSFSWWGAWLANKGEVYYPSIWFGPAINNNTEDMIPEHWNKIDL